MSLLSIDLVACIKCGICVEVCPVSIISFGEDGFPCVMEKDEKRCVLCGQCEAVCAAQALKQTSLPEMELIHKDKLNEITSDNLSEYVRSRRSVRAFLPRVVEQSTLEKILAVVSYSPTGVNRQLNKWIVVCNHDMIGRLSKAVIEWMKVLIQTNQDMAKRLGLQRLVDSFEKGKDVICRDARTLVIGYTDAAYSGGAADVIIATSQLELLLPSFGLGGCWAGYLMIALRLSQEVKSILGLDETQAVHTALMIGYPKYHYSKVPYRKKPNVVFFAPAV